MSNCMDFPKDYNKFIDDYAFEDSKQVYTYGSRLIPTFRVYQMIRHYFDKDANSTENHFIENNTDSIAFGKYPLRCRSLSFNAEHLIMTAIEHNGQVVSYDLAPNLTGIDYIEVNGVKFIRENSK